MSKSINKTRIKNSIGFGTVTAVLAILALGFAIMPFRANAQYDDNGSSYKKPGPTPFIFSISPNVVNVGDGPKTITISGNGFTPTSVARINGSARSTTFVDYDHLLIHLNASDFVGSSGRYINVYNENPGGGYSKSALLSINGYIVPTKVTTTTTYTNTNTNYNNTTNSNNSDSNYSNSQTQSSSDYDRNASGNTSSNSNDSASSLASNAIFGSNSFAPSGIIQWILFAIIILLIIIIVRKFFGGADRYHSKPLKYS